MRQTHLAAGETAIDLTAGEITNNLTRDLEFNEGAREVDFALAMCVRVSWVRLPKNVTRSMVIEHAFSEGFEPVCPPYAARARRAVIERLAFLETNGLIEQNFESAEPSFELPQLATAEGMTRYREVVVQPGMPRGESA
ncbi:hypothetical protein KA047_02555 [Candidatus Saccharibacteria bacterium]|nr:hypothetical protein [Candidatus Saccharibacteria bacterium]